VAAAAGALAGEGAAGGVSRCAQEQE